MAQEITITIQGQKARILAAASRRLQKTPQDLLASNNLTSLAWDEIQAAVSRMNRRVSLGEIEYPENIVSLIEDEAAFHEAARAEIAKASANPQ